jgi:hypothetical protein
VRDVDFDEQYHLIVLVGEDDVGPAHEVALALDGLELARFALEVRAAGGIFVHRTLVVNVRGPHGAGLPQHGHRPVVALGAASHHGRHRHPAPLL